MKISNKIFLLVLFLLAVLTVNTWVGLRQLTAMHNEFSAVANEDVSLMESLSTINALQLERNVLLEKVIAIAEEMGFSQVPFARAQYLQDQLKALQEGFNANAHQSAEALSRVKEVSLKAKWKRVEDSLKGIERSNANYNQLIAKMLESVQGGGFQLSIDDLYQFRLQEKVLSGELKELLVFVRKAMHESLSKSRHWRDKSSQVLFLSLSLSAFLSLLVAFWIIKRISNSMKDLQKAAQQVGQGNFVINLKPSKKDEITDVSRAFNIMSQKLQAFTGQLEQKNADLHKVNAELDAFAHTVSHDIVEPLTGIVGYSSYLDKNYAPSMDQKGRDCVQGIRKSATRLNNLLKDLLELTRISRVKNPYTKFSVQDLLREVLVDCEYAIAQAKTEVVVHGPFPEVLADRIKMGHIFRNLISNAVKFSSRAANPKVEIGCRETPEGHEFYIQDNGIGLSDPAAVFLPFQRLTEAREYEGSGIGLAIAKAAVESHGGRLWAPPQTGVGAIFIFTIPIKK